MTADTKPIDVTRATAVVRKAAAQAEFDALPPKDRRFSTWERLVRKWAEADREGGEWQWLRN